MTLTPLGADIARGIVYGVTLAAIGYNFTTWQFWFAITSLAIFGSITSVNTETK